MEHAELARHAEETGDLQMSTIETSAETYLDISSAASSVAAPKRAFLPAWLSHALRYTGVNLLACVLDVSVFVLLNHLIAAPTIASCIGYACGIVLNYHLTKHFVFHGHVTNKTGKRMFMEFMATGLVGLALTALMTGLGVHYLGLTPELSKLISLLTCFVVLYFMRAWLVFRPIA
jgi:putative flippase GtrA